MQRGKTSEQPGKASRPEQYTYLVQLVQGGQVLSSASLHFPSLLPFLPMARRRHVVVVLLLLFLQLAALIPASVAAGRGNAEAAVTEEEEERGGVGAMMRQTLGSRPPSCEGQCRWPCGGRRCEAVQVPITPHDGLPQGQSSKEEKKKEKETTSPAPAAGGGGAAAVLLPSSYLDRSNYKPLGWRCKCLHA